MKEDVSRLLTHAVDAVYPSSEFLASRLEKGEKLRVYLGVDPTSEILHIGHAIPLQKLREFQDMGHEVILLIGSFTAMIGDPTDKMAARVQLTQEQVLANAKSYQDQAAKILRFDGENPAQLKFNHEWLSAMKFEDVIQLASHFTVQQMVERDMFEKRLEEGKPVYLHEFFYPLMQAYDSVAMDVDVEIGGSDQTFNMLAGRTLMKSMTGKEKAVVTTRLLTNDEGKKMSKSEGGLIALTDAPEEMYGKIMAMADDVIVPYFEIVTLRSEADVADVKKRLADGVNPKEVKMELAREVVTMFVDADAATRAEAHFEQVFSRGELPEEMPEFVMTGAMNVVDLLVAAGLVSSKSEARRAVDQGGVKIDGTVVEGQDVQIEAKEAVLQKGKRHFVRLVRG